MTGQAIRSSLLLTRQQLIRTAVGGAGLLASPFVSRRGARGAEPITLKFALTDTARSPIQVIADRFAELVDRNSKGAVKIQSYPLGTIGTAANVMSGIKTGVIDLMTLTTGWVGASVPTVQLVDLPFLFRDAVSAEKLLDGPIGQKLFDAMPAKGMLGLVWGCYGWQEVQTVDRPVHEPGDLKGLKIRVQPGQIFSAAFTAVGATPVLIDISEAYIGLSQGVINGYELPLAAVLSTKLYEVSKYVALVNEVYNALPLIANKNKFEALDNANQTAIRDAAHEVLPFWRDLIAKSHESAKTTLQQHGQQVNDVDGEAFRSAMQPVYAQFRDIIGPDLVDQTMKALA
jgi:tripartite ATP-independent transporter DctP family solute receptor